MCREGAHSSSSCRLLSELTWSRGVADIQHRIGMSSAPGSSSWRRRALRTPRSPAGSSCRSRSCRSGGSASSRRAWLAWRSVPAPVVGRLFPPELVVAVKAIACELPARLGLPLSRLHVPDIRSEVIRRGLVASISDTTIWRWLSEDAIKPWTHRSWIFPRDPDFGPKAGRVLDLYAGEFEGRRLKVDEFVISADEKTSIQARIRCHPTLPPVAGRPMRVEHEYERGGALQYLAAWDVHRAKLFGRCEPTTGIEPFGRLVDQVMKDEPYRSARRVFTGSRQRQLAPGPDRGPASDRGLPASRARPSPDPRQLAEPGRDLLQHPPAQGPHAGRFRLAR